MYKMGYKTCKYRNSIILDDILRCLIILLQKNQGQKHLTVSLERVLAILYRYLLSV